MFCLFQFYIVLYRIVNRLCLISVTTFKKINGIHFKGSGFFIISFSLAIASYLSNYFQINYFYS